MKLFMELLRRFTENPIVKTIVQLIPMIWVVIVLNIFGYRLGLTDRIGAGATQIGEIVTIFVFVFVGLYILLTNFLIKMVSRRDADVRLQKALDAFANFASEISYTEVAEVRDISYEQSKARLQEILIMLIKFVSTISYIDKEHISASVFYTFNGNRNECDYVFESNRVPALDPQTIMYSNQSFGNHLLHSPSEFEFMNDVKVGEIEGKYILTNRNRGMFDITRKYGSTIGLSIIKASDEKGKYGHRAIEAVVFVSTFGYEIVNEESKNTYHSREVIEKLIERVMLRTVKKQIERELEILAERP
ncbi:MAG: hypothetical protein FWG68_10340 [Defluviitaleaceae bacterium]|nr:hypothetical protein [Defluviitaleaceae bacterium]